MDILQKEQKLLKLEEELRSLDDETAIKEISDKIKTYKQHMMSKLMAWDRVLLARHAKRPGTKEVINAIFEDFIELSGDRLYEDDKAIIGGVAFFDDQPLTIIGQRKGKNTEDNIKNNFGMPHPEGYRKALRLMKQAEKFNRPIVTFIDTPGAFPGVGAESRGQAMAIANNLYEMSDLKVPLIAFVLGEGGSGGALAIGVGNRVFMMENSIYSILSPEGYASILWKDAKKAKEASEVMKLTSYDLYDFGIIDGIIKEPIGGAHHDPMKMFEAIHQTLRETLLELNHMSRFEIATERYNKFRKMGFLQRFNYENLQEVVK